MRGRRRGNRVMSTPMVKKVSVIPAKAGIQRVGLCVMGSADKLRLVSETSNYGQMAVKSCNVIPIEAGIDI